MTDWTEGYVADIDYAFAYNHELNPVRMPLALLSRGLQPPAIGTACELGFGQGLGTNIHAAASSVAWYGTDFIPAQAAFAQELSDVAGSGAVLLDEAFDDFCHRTDLPDFDFVALHGVWSWVNEQNRSLIVDFLSRKLKPGGLVYLGYNSAAGWSGFAPIRDLMKVFSETMVPPSVAGVDRVSSAVAFAQKFFAANPAYAAAHPTLVERFEKITGQDPHYLAHEYFCRDWHPMHFADMAERLRPAKLGYACSARYISNMDGLNLSPEQIALLNDIPEGALREAARDVMVARRFRFDLWTKGARRLSPLTHADMLRSSRVVLLKPRAEVSLKVDGALLDVEMQESIYGPILDVIGDQTPKTIGAIETAVASKGLTLGQIVQAVLVLGGDTQLTAAQDDDAIGSAKSHTDRLNRHLIAMARDSGSVTYLASPVTGGGVRVGQAHQLFLLALTEGRRQPEDWADFVWPILAQQGQKIVKDGRTLETDEENRAEFLEQAKAFADGFLPVLRALQVVPE
ncbi:MAG: methyltransferase regulatory domain-containing protein [Pseudomonadota bacterium]